MTTSPKYVALTNFVSARVVQAKQAYLLSFFDQAILYNQSLHITPSLQPSQYLQTPLEQKSFDRFSEETDIRNSIITSLCKESIIFNKGFYN